MSKNNDKREMTRKINQMIEKREEDKEDAKELSELLEKRNNLKLSDDLKKLVNDTESDIKILRQISKNIRKGDFDKEDQKTLDYIINNDPVIEFMNGKVDQNK
jgi:hypothetical protein